MGRLSVILLGLLYLLLFGALGLTTPLATLAFQSSGFAPAGIAILVTVGAFARVAVPPGTGALADRTGRRRVLVGAGAVAAAAALALASSPPGLVFALAWAIYVGASTTQVPLTDVLAHGALAPRSERYAWVRVWGSLGFAISVLIAGQLALSREPARLFLAVAALHAATAVVANRLTEVAPRTGARPRRRLSAAFGAAARAGLGGFLLATGLHSVGFGIYDAYFALRLRDLGLGDDVVGGAVALGVTAEILLMIVAPRFVATVGARRAARLALVGVLAAVVRWLTLASTESLPVILVVQPLHALSFGLWMLAVVAHVQDRAPPDLKASLQGAAVSAVGLGALTGAGLGGLIATRLGPGASFFLAAGCSAMAGLLYARVDRRVRLDGERSVTSGD